MENYAWFVCLFCCLTSQATAVVMSGQSVHRHIFLDKLDWAVNQYFVHILSLVNDNIPSWMNQWKGGEWPISTKVWDRARIKRTTPGFAVRHVNAWFGGGGGGVGGHYAGITTEKSKYCSSRCLPCYFRLQTEKKPLTSLVFVRFSYQNVKHFKRGMALEKKGMAWRHAKTG